LATPESVILDECLFLALPRGSNMILEMLYVIAALAASDTDLVQEVVCAETGFSRAAEAKDKQSFLDFVDPDARFVGGRVSRGRAEVGEAWSPLLSPDGPSIRWRPAIVEVTADGMLALSRGPYRSISVDENGNETESWGHFNSTWRRNEDGRWLVVFDVGGDAGMTPSEEEIAVLASEPDCP
jgi:ketosteroid isomerase-like protein